MQDASHCFHSFKDVFLVRQAGRQAQAKANALRMELVKKQNVDKETNAETWMPSKSQHKINAWWHNVSHEIVDSPK
jgi:hypothetical protein